MALRVELSPLAFRNLESLDNQDAKRILKFLCDRVAILDDPRSIGEALKGVKLWKYRFIIYNIIADIEDNIIRIVIVRTENMRISYMVLKS